MKTELVKIGDVKTNPNNPRTLKDDKFKKLVKSIQEFPEMLEIRPIVVNDDMVVLGGNMRLKACKEAGLKEIHIIKASNLTEDQQKQFIIKDNVGFGEWDWDMLANEWNSEELDEWGLDVPNFETEENFEAEDEINEVDIKDLFDIKLPFYTPNQEIPKIKDMANQEKTIELINEIEKLDLDVELKEILIKRASFFTDFNFSKIADFYSKQNNEVKELFEKLGMVIVAPERAVELGFVDLKENIEDL